MAAVLTKKLPGIYGYIWCYNAIRLLSSFFLCILAAPPCEDTEAPDPGLAGHVEGGCGVDRSQELAVGGGSGGKKAGKCQASWVGWFSDRPCAGWGGWQKWE